MKAIKGYEGSYSITRDGEVWSHKTNKFLSKFVTSDVRACVSLYGTKKKRLSVMRIMAELYTKRPSKDHTKVSCKDGNPLNNKVENVLWMTDVDSAIKSNAVRKERNYESRRQPIMQNHKKGTRHLTELEKVDVIRLMDKGYTPGVIANALGVYLDEVMAICHSSKYIKESQYD